MNWTVGKTYNRRRDLHDKYGGQRQGGISTPSAHPLIFLFTGESGAQYGYRDGPRPDGTCWYTGEGQVGDMEMVRGNRAIRDHVTDGKQLHLFEDVVERQ
jgi:5-methylcytosine-specific restriction protein A